MHDNLLNILYSYPFSLVNIYMQMEVAEMI